MSAGRWYFHAESAHFHGFTFVEADEDPADVLSDDAYGPFKTFGAAKENALGYFRTDKADAERALAEIKAIKKKDIE